MVFDLRGRQIKRKILLIEKVTYLKELKFPWLLRTLGVQVL